MYMLRTHVLLRHVETTVWAPGFRASDTNPVRQSNTDPAIAASHSSKSRMSRQADWNLGLPVYYGREKWEPPDWDLISRPYWRVLMISNPSKNIITYNTISELSPVCI
jgi:hypothetical protein